jgi:anti-anti-sigma factor
MQIDVYKIDEVIILDITGDLVYSNCSSLVNRINRLVKYNPSRDFLLDFNQVKQIDSTGISELVSLSRAMNGRERHLVMVLHESPIYKLFKLAGLDNYFKMFSEKDPAFEYLKKAPAISENP